MKVTAVIPTWNEAGCIARMIGEIPRDVVSEIIVVDGHSPDGTADIVKKIDGVTLLMQEGKGFGAAIAQGFRAATGDAIIVLDGDGSHNPADIPKLVEKVAEGYDYVMAARYRPGSRSEDDTFVRYFGNMFFTFLVNVLYKTNVSDSLYLFTCIRRTALEKITLRSRGFEFCIELLVKAHKAGLKIAEVPSSERSRFSGASKVNAFRHGFVILLEILRARKY
jgi:glycosyltransferase involved in cell wall biosynthesis